MDLLFMFGKHRPQKPTGFFSLPTKWKVSPKTDEILGDSGTATAVNAVPGAAAPLFETLSQMVSLRLFSKVIKHAICLLIVASHFGANFNLGTGEEICQFHLTGLYVWYSSNVNKYLDKARQLFKMGRSLLINVRDLSSLAALESDCVLMSQSY